MTPTTRSIDTPQGEARLVSHRARSPFVTLLLSHGAGGGIDARDLQALADRLPRHGANVISTSSIFLSMASSTMRFNSASILSPLL